MKKIISTLLATAVMVPICITSAMALSNQSNTQGLIQPRFALCDNCGNGMLVQQDSEYGGWSMFKYYPCEHGYPKGEDRDQKHKQYDIFSCSSCGFTLEDVGYDYRTFCYGRNRSVQDEE